MPGHVPGIFLRAKRSKQMHLTLAQTAGINRVSLFCRTFPYEL